MKKSIIALALMSGLALADTAQFADVTSKATDNGVTLTPDGKLTGEAAAMYTTGGNNNCCQTTVAVDINLTLASKVTGNTNIVYTGNNGNEVGLFATTSGISGKGATSTYGSISWDDLANNAGAYTLAGEKHIVLVVTMDGPTKGQSLTGLHIYDPAGTQLFANTGLAWAGNAASSNSFGTVTFSTAYVSGIALTPGIASSEDIVNMATNLATAVQAAPITLTATGVNSFEGGVLDLAVAKNLTGVTNDLSVVVGQFAWEAIVAAVGDINQSVDITINGIALDQFGAVTFNTYAGEADGKYVVSNIPEPATATLSLLALAGLASRRRRK